jgi:hypothetical protein
MLEERSDLLPNACAALELSDEERLLFLRQPRWIGYSQTKDVLRRLDALLRHPPTHRMPNLLIVGETNNGKTTLLERFSRLHPAEERPDEEHAFVPVLLVQAPPVPEEGRFYNVILEQLHAPYRAHAAGSSKQIQVLRILKGIGLKMLMIDEIHHLLAGSIVRQRQFLNVLKYIGNELKIPLVGAGTVEAIRAISSDPQLANRFEPIVLRRWKLDDEFFALLASFERLLPLRKRSSLTSAAIAGKLMSMCEGTIGELHRLLSIAAEYAILSGEEKIDINVLKNLDWHAPSERGRLAARIV